ncbi:MAG: tetratricopeptide repeat protein [bacterium]|nr:tetratricopeptide repeat protein [bacterium]
MRQHRVIWIITGCVVVAAAIVLAVRRANAPGRDPEPRRVSVFSQHQSDVLVGAMLSCLERDPRAQRIMTRRFVEAVADMAEEGMFESAEAYYALGLRLYGTRKRSLLSKAEEAYRKAIAIRPDWAMAHNALGIVLHGQGRLEEAEASFRTAIDLAPGWSRPYNDLAVLFRLSDRMAEAEEFALKALELDPDNVATHNNYGNLLLATDRLDDAEDAYLRAIELQPDQPKPYFNLACLASRRGNTDDAFAFLNCAIALHEIWREEAKSEPNFDNLRELPEFRRLIHD